ncbi:uncharacterized protein [Nicotiana tomentosiformis]|uniref:uncharacterized protein n=1 Tax=Nicotiana tomentosiformis TaxID=4098 RepID=UPI00388C6020
MPQQISRVMVSATVASLPSKPTRDRGQAARGRGQAIRGGCQAIRGGGQIAKGSLRGKGQSGGDQSCFYAFPARLEAESSDAVITGNIPVFHRDASVLFDLDSIYYYMSSYFASYLVMPRNSFSARVYISTHMGDSIIVDCVYHSCVVSIGRLETSVDLLLLDMLDFDVILDMDWLLPYHTILDYHAKTVTLAMSRLPRLEWRGTHGHSTSKVISYVEARHMVKKGCLALFSLYS